jgi:hypothetical protein
VRLFGKKTVHILENIFIDQKISLDERDGKRNGEGTGPQQKVQSFWY